MLSLASRLACNATDQIDPFLIKQRSKLHPARILYTAGARIIESEARANFGAYELPHLDPAPGVTQVVVPPSAVDQRVNTRLTLIRLQMVLYYASVKFRQLGGAVGEVGCYRGVTTRALAEHTRALIYAIDPFAEYGGNSDDFATFCQNISGHPNIVHIKKTSGQARKDFASPCFSFIFLDAVNDYVNVKHDAQSWGELLIGRGGIAINGADDIVYPGCHKAVYDFAMGPYDLIAHSHGMCVFERRP